MLRIAVCFALLSRVADSTGRKHGYTSADVAELSNALATVLAPQYLPSAHSAQWLHIV